MKKILILLFAAFLSLPAFCQQCYWVFLTDKQGVEFDPYSYFDAKAIERYQQCGADLYDITNYPLNADYVGQVNALATEEVGTSRWLNAVAVMATPVQIEAIGRLSFVSHTVQIGGDMRLAEFPSANAAPAAPATPVLTEQLVRMQGQLFRDKGYDGKGMRIAVLDGGFPRVNTHQAFKHLRDNRRILDTWNFPNRKADVYGWSTHGLATLSCITGVVNGCQLGLATGAEFLLYRTEVDLEPFKEEVWWMQGMERADQHGANIISSSLGYGKERYWTKDMDGTSYVAKAGNLAARKGILVCCSAGNEADEGQWKTIVTPSDADSVLCIGGIEDNLTSYKQIFFSSYGPSADGRLKPNVAAFGHAMAAANGSDTKTDMVYGTSFSCPLVAGFAACAWQAMRDKNNMEMFQLIQQSADRYPYYDYALGYGVPQASFFVEGPQQHAPTFVIRDTKDTVEIHLLDSTGYANIFFNKQRPDGTLVSYYNIDIEDHSELDCLYVAKGSLDSCTLNVCYKGYTASYRLSDADFRRLRFEHLDFQPKSHLLYSAYSQDAAHMVPSKWGNCARYRSDIYGSFGTMLRTDRDERTINYYSPAVRVGGRVMRAFGKAYCLGLGLELGTTRYNFDPVDYLPYDGLYTISQEDISKKQYRMFELGFELFQRVRFVPGSGRGIFWDLGFYASHANYRYHVEYDNYPYAQSARLTIKNTHNVDAYRWNCGLTTRFGYDAVALYARYRTTGMFTQYDLNPESPTAFFMRLPRLEVGLQLLF